MVFDMAVQSDMRDYRMLDAELCMFTSNLCNDLTRDLTDLTPFGLTAPKIAALKALGDAFEVLPPDDVFIGELMIATAAKNALLEQVKETVRNMALRVEMKWGSGSGQYRTLSVVNMNRFTEDMMLVTARNVHARMTAYLSDLTDQGLTSAMLTAFAALNESFEVARNTMVTKVETRDTKAQERVAKGNELYSFVVIYCEIGKRVYAAANPAKYNDYVIYGGSGGGSLTAPADFNYDAVTNLFAWAAVANATSYEISFSENHVDWLPLWTGTDTEYFYIPTVGVSTEYRCRARNSGGFGDYCSAITVIFNQPLPAPVSVSVTTDMSLPPNIYIVLNWGLVTGATYYKVYESVVEFGQPAGIFTEIGNFVPNTMRKLAIRNRRYYYKVKACNESASSGESAVVVIDVAG